MNTLKPSNAARRMACAGSHKLESLYPQDNSDYAQEGVAAHWLASEILRVEQGQRSGYVSATLAPNGIEITDEMVEGAELYVGFITANEFADEIHIEERMHIATIHPDCWGTPDCWTVQNNQGMQDNNFIEINIYDYKFGRGFVEVYENWQLIEYAAGIIDKLGIDGLTDQRTQVHMHVIQPRSFHPEGQIRSWTIRASELRPYFNRLRGSENDAMAETATTNVSSECNYCTARHSCPALANSAMLAVDIAGSAIPHVLTAEQVSSELRFLEHHADLLAARISGLSAEALALLKQGQRLPHHHAERGKGRERWTLAAEEVAAFGEMMGVPLSKPSVITPKQAIALKHPMLAAEQVRAWSETPYGELKLVPLDTRKTDKLFGGK